MAKTKTWLSEEEMYQVIEQSSFFRDFLRNYPLKNGTILKQQVISDCGKRPDYMLVSSDESNNYVFIIEVKITASLETLGQLQKYENILNSLIVSGKIPANTKIQKIIIGRFFDKNLQPFMDDWMGQEFICYKLDLISIDQSKPNVKSWEIIDLDREDTVGSVFFANELVKILGEQNESKQMV